MFTPLSLKLRMIYADNSNNFTQLLNRLRSGRNSAGGGLGADKKRAAIGELVQAWHPFEDLLSDGLTHQHQEPRRGAGVQVGGEILDGDE